MFNPIEASENIKDEFVSYVSTRFHIADKDYAVQFEDELNKKDVIAKGPYLDITDSFKTGDNIESLIEAGEMSPLFRQLEASVDEGDKEIKLIRKLYLHQQKAIERINRNKNLVVTTGTGSGKTECFILPIINHLLREQEAGTLDDGVRAIIIYPMNALANDQMKRLRLIFKNYKDITFGVYTGNTKYDDVEGIAEYGEVFEDANGAKLKPLPNEVISRKTMQEKPPHILITNYAMLEHMMLRPNDDKVFSGAKLRFLILDEAHIYKGATGIETSLLVRRLKARISSDGEIRHILTSATLGGEEENDDIINFAETLCDAKFDSEDIIRSETVIQEFNEEIKDYPLQLFAELAEQQDSLNAILDKYGISYDASQKDEEKLYDLFMSSGVYRELRRVAVGPMTVSEMSKQINRNIPVSEQDLVNIINVASRAEKNKAALIKARYHMFVRALDGAYISIVPSKKTIYLNRSQYTPDGENRVFEAAVCDYCGRVGIAGKKNNGIFEFASDIRDTEYEVYLLREQNELWDFGDEEDDDETNIDKNDYIICSKCGAICDESLKDELCDCGSEYYIKIRKAEIKGERKEHRCPFCNHGNVKKFYLGYDAATAVLGTELFEQLPETETVIKSEIKDIKSNDNIFAQYKLARNKVGNCNETDNMVRQFLSFSDSRSEAAYFACYMTSFYEMFLRRRGIWHVIEKNKKRSEWTVNGLVDEVTKYFVNEKTFKTSKKQSNDDLEALSRSQAWFAVLNEMVNAGSNTSLMSVGIIDIVYGGNPDGLMEEIAEHYGKNKNDVTALFNLLVMDIVYNGALHIPYDSGISLAQKEEIFHTPVDHKFVLQISANEKRKNLRGWIPKQGYSNNRVKRVMQTLGISKEESIEFLANYWDNILELNGNEKNGYQIDPDQFVIRVGNDDVPLYVCEKCGKTTMTNCQDRCVTIRCGGTLKKVSRREYFKNNHYVRLYSNKKMHPLRIKEHTAQLGKRELEKYQNMFVQKKINALSCSTTFEMGVDVGDLETVYLRNIPPSPANYVQRAGRAGRSIHSAAYALTYAKLGSHDFNYYDKPERMISGKIGVPLITIKNEKVVLRHIFAVALSDFFNKHENVYNKNNAHVLLNEHGFEELVNYLAEKPKKLKNLLKKSIPVELHEVMGINDFSWIDKLIGTDGILKIAVEDFRNTVAWYEEALKKDSSLEKSFREFRKAPGDTHGRDKNGLIEFLVRNNVLPKYGFPVDTVELYTGLNATGGNPEDKIKLIRDLQLAIAEYAPGAQVVADGKLYTSRYIRKLPQKTGEVWEDVYIAECQDNACKTWNHRRVKPSGDKMRCISCGNEIEKSKWMSAIEPRKGFIAEALPKPVPLRKPDRAYKSDDYYIGDLERQVINKTSFMINGRNKLQMETSANDSLMVVCTEKFFVCNRCGYAISVDDVKNDSKNKKLVSYALSHEIQHKSPMGEDCENVKLYKKALCHSFKTDVVKIVFGIDRANDHETMLSVMFALLEAMSEELNIERTDIKGCLHRVRYEGSMIYSIILYDAVAGGAGHVRRLVTEDCAVFQRVVEKAIDITKNCRCTPSCYNCLRNYNNQAVHDILDREKAYKFLEIFTGEVAQTLNEDSKVTQISYKELKDELIIKDTFPSGGQFDSWSGLSVMLPEKYLELWEEFDTYDIPIPEELYCKGIVKGLDKEIEILIRWKNAKIMLFDNDSEMIKLPGWKSVKVSDIRAKALKNSFQGGK
ncbi:DEAD/DEAH box helicase [Anaerovibrio sp. RM50]|uniref:DEAD/DEAH box helicase n=1 Tax=Anaerovibrio sp. RM50 TaxID=1200557 RepID=UPI0004818F6A|nr:DEAD/DEAH box helicase [Anaerovibrio sp. RM50]